MRLGKFEINFHSNYLQIELVSFLRLPRLRESRGNRKFWCSFSRREKQGEFLKIKSCSRMLPYLGFCFGGHPSNEWDYCTSLHCICDCSLAGISSSISLCSGSGINVILMLKKTQGKSWEHREFDLDRSMATLKYHKIGIKYIEK